MLQVRNLSSTLLFGIGAARDALGQLRVGPPLFLVVRGLNLSTASPDVAHVCGISGCHPNSLVNRVAAAAAAPGKHLLQHVCWNPRTDHATNIACQLAPRCPLPGPRPYLPLPHIFFSGETSIAAPVASWMDDFMAWLNPGLPQCCREHVPLLETPHLQRQLMAPGPGSSGSKHPHSNLAHRSLRTPLSLWPQDEGGGYCPPPDQAPCAADATACADCNTCVSNAFQGAGAMHPA